MKRILAILIALALLILGNVTPALALTSPDSISFQSVRAFRNLTETGDMAIFFHTRIDYTSYPSTPATYSILFRLYDGTSLLATSRPYVFASFSTNGYGDGISSFYFTAADAPTWGEEYQINILGVPLYFNPIETLTYTLTDADYSTAVETADSQADLYNYIINRTDTLKTIYPAISLAATTDTGKVLSTYGEFYFRGATPGIQSMSPQLFFIQVAIPEKMEVETYTMDLEDTYTARLVGTDLMRGAERIGDTLGDISGAFVFGIIAFAGAIGLCIFTLRQGWGVEPGMLGAVGIMVLGAIIVGDFFFTLTMIGGLVAGMAIMYVFALKRA